MVENQVNRIRLRDQVLDTIIFLNTNDKYRFKLFMPFMKNHVLVIVSMGHEPSYCGLKSTITTIRVRHPFPIYVLDL